MGKNVFHSEQQSLHYPLATTPTPYGTMLNKVKHKVVTLSADAALAYFTVNKSADESVQEYGDEVVAEAGSL